VIIHDVEQGSSEWGDLRRGIPTASNFVKILTGTGKLSASADDYICTLISDKYCLIPEAGVENFTSRAVNWGQQTEESARRWYAMESRSEVSKVGFITTDDGRFGGSPDALVGPNGGLELKCPQGDTHVGYCLKNRIPPKYIPQVHGHLVITNVFEEKDKRLWWDWVSYCPYRAGPPGLRIRVQPDDYTKKLADVLLQFDKRYRLLEDRFLNGEPLESLADSA
jgi:hypothetical protein